MKMKSLLISLALSCVLILGSCKADATSPGPNATLLATGLEGALGSTIGPDGALYVTESTAGRVSRVDPQTGAITTFASGLPPTIPDIGYGGALDVTFLGGTAYVLVTLVGPDVGGTDVVGIYRVDGQNSVTVVADIGEFSIDNPPKTPFEVPSGVQYALQTYGDSILVTDGHHNRVLRVTLDGQVTELIAFGNIVPTGLDVLGDTIYMAEAGPLPHRAEDGKVVRFEPGSTSATEVAAGAPLLVDVEFGRGNTQYALAQGVWDGAFEGSPALPSTGSLVEVNADGTFTVVTGSLSQPTSLEFIGTTAYVVTLLGEIWKITLQPTSELANISARGFVQTGENVLIGGFIVRGSDMSHRVLVRALGPSISSSVSTRLTDPTLDLRDSNGVSLAFNDNWQDNSGQASEIIATGIPPTNNLESAIVANLPAGAYTAVVAGRNGGTGIGLVEVYNLSN